MDNAVLTKVVRRYNREIRRHRNVANVDLGEVDLQKAKSLLKDLNAMGPNGKGLWHSLVYCPRDMSVYIRSISKHSDIIVDVSLCTRDITYCSNQGLKNIEKCGLLVGKPEYIAEVHFDELSPIVQSISQNRVVHRVAAFKNIITVELARSYDKSRDTLNVDVAGFEAQLFGEAGYDNFERIRDVPPKIAAAWLMCMTLMEKETGDCQLIARRDFLESCCKNMKENCMKDNVNYMHMFRARRFRYQEGRITWPCVLGLATADNLHYDFSELIKVEPQIANLRGTYQGQYVWQNFAALGTQFVFFGLSIVVIRFIAVEGIVTITLFVLAFCVPLVNYCFMKDPKPWTVVKLDDRTPPSPENRLEKATQVLMSASCKHHFHGRDLCFTLEKATQVLMSASCKHHFHGRDLCFTGETYEGVNDFAYSFTYDELCEIGFLKKCDGSGREYLLVPGTGAVVRMDDKAKHASTDHFELMGNPPCLYDKCWRSPKGPGKNGKPKPLPTQDAADCAQDATDCAQDATDSAQDAAYHAADANHAMGIISFAQGITLQSMSDLAQQDAIDAANALLQKAKEASDEAKSALVSAEVASKSAEALSAKAKATLVEAVAANLTVFDTVNESSASAAHFSATAAAHSATAASKAEKAALYAAKAASYSAKAASFGNQGHRFPFEAVHAAQAARASAVVASTSADAASKAAQNVSEVAGQHVLEPVRAVSDNAKTASDAAKTSSEKAAIALLNAQTAAESAVAGIIQVNLCDIV